MKTKTVFVLLVISTILSCQEKSNETIRIKNFEIEIPASLSVKEPFEKYNELLSLRYKNELKILITDDTGSPDKSNERKQKYEETDFITTALELKFDRWYKLYKGYETGELIRDNINSFTARTKDFKAKAKDDIVYFEISSINIGNYYYDLIVTGKEQSRKQHKVIVDQLKSSIVKISDN